MKKSINTCVFAAILFYFTMLLASLFNGESKLAYTLAYIACFVLPVVAVLVPSRILGAPLYPLGLGIDKREARFTLPLILPMLGAVMLVSFATSELMALGGFSNSLVINEPLPYALLIYALIPSLGEELVFRYIPIRLIGAHSEKAAVLISALIFSLAHASLFQIPYALIAGVFFALLDIKCKSVLPSVVIHLINNVLGVLLALYTGEIFMTAVLAVLALAALVSLVFLAVHIRRYFDAFSSIISHGFVCFTVPLALFLAFMLTLAALSLVVGAV